MASWIILGILCTQHFSYAENKVELYDEVKGEIIASDRASREFMSKLYDINKRMKAISKKRNNLSNRMINTEANIKDLAKTTVQLEEIIKKQRSSLSKRIRTLYMLGEDKIIRAIFSANNSEDLQQMLKYLKIFSEQDYHLIRSYESNLKILSKKRIRLEKNIARLIRIRKNLKKEEKYLLKDQKIKSNFLGHLTKSRKKSLKKLNSLKKNLDTDVLDLSFFEKKGKLPRPFEGRVVQKFGMVEHPKYKYRLSHKGLLYKSNEAKPVKAIANGRVVFAGKIDGYGQTTVLDHGDHYYSVYAGLPKIKVNRGEKILAAQDISPDANEVYFELRHFSDAIDPKNWMKR